MGIRTQTKEMTKSMNQMSKDTQRMADRFVKKYEKVNHPEHYNKGIEAIDYIESHDMNFNQGNIIKYVTRAEHKGEKKQDLEKAKWYIERELERCLIE